MHNRLKLIGEIFFFIQRGFLRLSQSKIFPSSPQCTSIIQNYVPNLSFNPNFGTKLCKMARLGTKGLFLQAITKMGFVSNTEEEAGKCLKEMDLDGDGKVSYAEFMVKWKIT